jgi:hypothetical protein
MPGAAGGGALRMLAAAVLLLAAAVPTVQAECEIPRNASRAEACAYVRAPVNEWCVISESPASRAVPVRLRIAAPLSAQIVRRTCHSQCGRRLVPIPRVLLLLGGQHIRTGRSVHRVFGVGLSTALRARDYGRHVLCSSHRAAVRLAGPAPSRSRCHAARTWQRRARRLLCDGCLPSRAGGPRSGSARCVFVPHPCERASAPTGC